jgi:hypothetical protein
MTLVMLAIFIVPFGMASVPLDAAVGGVELARAFADRGLGTLQAGSPRFRGSGHGSRHAGKSLRPAAPRR